MRDQSGHFVYDPKFVAALPPTERKSRRWLDMLQRLVEILEEKSAVVTQEQQQSGGKFPDRNVGAPGLAVLVSARHQFEPDAAAAYSAGQTSASRGTVSRDVAACGRAVHVQPGYSIRALCRPIITGSRALLYALEEHIRRHLEIIVPSQAIVIPLKARRATSTKGKSGTSAAWGARAGCSGSGRPWVRRT